MDSALVESTLRRQALRHPHTELGGGDGQPDIVANLGKCQPTHAPRTVFIYGPHGARHIPAPGTHRRDAPSGGFPGCLSRAYSRSARPYSRREGFAQQRPAVSGVPSRENPGSADPHRRPAPADPHRRRSHRRNQDAPPAGTRGSPPNPVRAQQLRTRSNGACHHVDARADVSARGQERAGSSGTQEDGIRGFVLIPGKTPGQGGKNGRVRIPLGARFTVCETCFAHCLVLWSSLECSPPCQGGGRGFKSRQDRLQPQRLRGWVAQLVRAIA